MTPVSAEPGSSSPQPPRDHDAALVARMAAGDEAALAELYDRWAGRLYSLALQTLKQPDRAEDVLEEALWQAWRGAGSYSPARKTVATWLLTIARRKSLERLRARPRPRDVDLETPYAAPDPSFGEAEQRSPGAEHAAAFERVLRNLPDSERLPLELAYFHGLGQSEIAERLDQPLGTVRTNLRLAVQRVRQETAPLLSRPGTP